MCPRRVNCRTPAPLSKSLLLRHLPFSGLLHQELLKTPGLLFMRVRSIDIYYTMLEIKTHVLKHLLNYLKVTSPLDVTMDNIFMKSIFQEK